MLSYAGMDRDRQVRRVVGVDHLCGDDGRGVARAASSGDTASRRLLRWAETHPHGSVVQPALDPWGRVGREERCGAGLNVLRDLDAGASRTRCSHIVARDWATRLSGEVQAAATDCVASDRTANPEPDSPTSWKRTAGVPRRQVVRYESGCLKPWTLFRYGKSSGRTWRRASGVTGSRLPHCSIDTRAAARFHALSRSRNVFAGSR